MFLSCLQNVHYTISFQSESDISVGKQNEMEARQFEQHQNTIGHKNQGRKPGQTALPDLRNIPQVELTLQLLRDYLQLGGWQKKMLLFTNLVLWLSINLFLIGMIATKGFFIL